MLDSLRRFEMQIVLARQLGHLTRSGKNQEGALQILREATDGEMRKEVDALERVLKGADGEARSGKDPGMPVATLARLAAVARKCGRDPVGIFARAEEVLGPLGESYLVYWSGISAFLWYVLALFVMLIFMLFIFSVFVFPQLDGFFEGSGKPLPGLTLLTINALRTFVDLSLFVFLGGVTAMMVAAQRIRRSMRRMEPISGLMERVPWVASLCDSYNAALSLNLSRLLVCAGIDAEEALSEVSRLWPGRTPFAEEVAAAKGRLDGVLCTDPLKGSLLLAQRTGTLGEELEHLSAAAQALFAAQLSRVREEFTLVAQIIAGVVSATVLVSVYLPLFKMGELL